MEEAFNARATAESLIGWLKEKIGEAGAEGGVFGLSGGIDSTVVAGLMKRAFPKHSLGILLPVDSLPADKDDALKVAEILDLPTLTLDLSATLVPFLAEMENSGLPKDRMAIANTKARLRMTALHYAATLRHSLVIGTGNRSELYVGYFTKYGDGGVDLLPLACLVKEQVKEVARYLGIPEELVSRTPSAGLYPGQTDEKEMGFTYEQLDRYILSGEIEDPMVKEKIDRMHRLSKHKREAIPCPSF
ncbi:MAG TPA: NAD(+) synthase [Chroococcales cyanobacterium]|jgi:NAD+ synthase